MWIVHWIAYHTGEARSRVVYGEHFAHQWAAALRGNGVAGVRVERGPVAEPAPAGVIVLAASWRK